MDCSSCSCLAVPVFALRLGTADEGNDPTSQTTRRAYDLLSEGFGPGSNGPLLVVAELTDPSQLSAMQALAGQIAQVPGVHAVTRAIPNTNGTAALIQVVPQGSPQDESTTELVHRLRADVIPKTVGSARHQRARRR